ncbi:MAG: hypothetical protein U9N36_03540 [Euryarchaeota archaeon]|nr:hypothetical protein [Euryarchaeota archaeon]
MIHLKGEFNDDDNVTAADAAIALRLAARGEYDPAADVGGGQVTALDVLTILQAASHGG